MLFRSHKAGDDVTVSVSFPKDYFVDTLAGKEAEFAVHINDVKHKVIPVIDDAFAKSISRHETLDELKESLKQQSVSKPVNIGPAKCCHCSEVMLSS